MKKLTFFKKICALSICLGTLAGILPANVPTVGVISARAAYQSVYPERISDEILFDDMETYTPGTTLTQLGATWAHAGNNQNEFAIIGELDGDKAVYYEGDHGYSTFSSPGQIDLKGELWIDVDMHLPEEYSDCRVQWGDYDGITSDRAQITFYKENSRARAMNIQDPDGVVKHIDLSYDVPQNEWFTLSLWFNTVEERYRVYINGVQLGKEMNMNHKFDYVLNDTDPVEAAFAKMSFCLNLAEGQSNSRVYFDNFRIGYAREINPVETMEITLDKGESYTFPEKISLPLNDGTIREFAITYTPVGNVLDTQTIGSYHYTAQIECYDEIVDVWFYVKERSIDTIDTVYEKVYKNESYTLPSTIPARMDDGSIKYLDVTWNSIADTSQVGTAVYTGTVEGYGEVTLNLEVISKAVLRADDHYVGVEKGEVYTMPTEVNVTLSNHKIGKASVTWEDAAASVDTSVLGKYEFSGTVEGYNEPIKLHVTVYEDDPDLELIFDTLVEFYDNCLNIARDRSAYFPEEYAQGYDPATPGKISENPHSPLFSMGIDRNTNTHALWPTVVKGERPLAVPATQGPLWKGLMGLTSLIDSSPEYQKRYEELHKDDVNDEGYQKYHNSVEEAHGYLINNYVSPSSGILMWGDHILQQFDDAQLDMQEEEDAYAYMIHQLECDYPEWDVLFSQNPEATEKYIKAFWRGHFNAQKEGVKLDTMEFSRHTSVRNTYSIEEIDNIFKARYDEDEVLIHKPSANALTFVNAAVDYAWAAVKLWQHTGDEDALHYARKMLWCFKAASDPVTGLVPFQYTDTGATNIFIGDPYDDRYKSNFPEGRARSSYKKVYENPELYGTTAEKVQDSWLLNQGKCGGGSFYMPLICFDIADVVGGEVGEEIEQWGIDALMGFVNYTYDHKTGLGKSGLTDGTVLDDYINDTRGYYLGAGRSQKPITITSDMSWVVLDGYERTNDQKVWEVLRSICMSFSLGDIGTAPGENIDVDIYTDCNDANMLLTLSRLYEITGAKEYYNLAKRIAVSILKERYINGFFYKSENSAYARLADPTPYCVLYFLAASEGVSKMIPHYQGESFDFQTNYLSDGDILARYGYTLFNQTITSEVLPSAVLCDIEELELTVGEQYAINAEAFPEDADDISLEWETDNTGVCIVEDGYVTAIAPGTCIVTAEAASGVSASVKITVK